jgi:hypothetical protein
MMHSFKNIPTELVPKVFQDAIWVVQRAGINYLWIVDSLCIIQDSVEDYEQESATMGSIYQGGFCNIAATGFGDGTNGSFVTREPSTIEPFKIF